jgi:uncharacterized protein (DUF2062 family)
LRADRSVTHPLEPTRWNINPPMIDHQTLLSSRWLRPFAHRLRHPALWHLNRRSVPRGLALGLFVGFILPVGQILLAALLAVPARANLPLSAAATLATNPITFPAIYYAAYRTGSALLANPAGAAAEEATAGFAAKFLHVTGPTALGLLVFACVAAALGYAAGSLWWRLRTLRRWKNRAAARRGLQGVPDA